MGHYPVGTQICTNFRDATNYEAVSSITGCNVGIGDVYF